MMYLTQEQLLLAVTIALAVVLVVTCILLIIVLCKLKKMRRRVDALTRGKDAESMEDRIVDFFERIECLEDAEKRMHQDINSRW